MDSQSTEETFDIVDENNELTGQVKSRSQAHKDCDWHRVVHIYVMNPQGQYLVHLRSAKKDIGANKWDNKFGGHVLAGESYDDAVLEELEQEIGLKVSLPDLKVMGLRKHDGGSHREQTKIYSYLFEGDIADLKFNDGEVEAVKWMTPQDILSDLAQHPDSWTRSTQYFATIIK